MASKKTYPLPVHALVTHPDMLRLSSHAFGGLFRLLLFYWCTKCKYVPSAENELLAITRITSAKIWKDEKALILEIFEAMRPDLHNYQAQRQGAYDIFAEWGRKTIAKRQERAANKALDVRGVRAFDSASEAHVVPKVAETSKARQVAERFKPKAAPKTGFTHRV